jgi:hypothetical protein
MLYEVDDAAPVLARLVPDVVRGFTIRKFCEPRGDFPLRVLVDDREEPQVVIGIVGAMLNVAGAIHRLNQALADLLESRVEARGGWPSAEIQAAWDQAGRRYLFFNASTYASWRAARIAGFEPEPHDVDGYVAYQWHFLGAPRFAGLVRHPCREAGGTELLEHIKQGVPYDPEGNYVKLCLEHGPSFVCELPDAEYARALEAPAPPSGRAGLLERWFQEAPDSTKERPALPRLRAGWQPVCWSCTHLTGFMGMIYTPVELRRHGFARSLAAFQIDAMLAREGIACCHVIDFNTPSMLLVQSMGGVCTPEPIVWRNVYWPGEAPREHDELKLP